MRKTTILLVIGLISLIIMACGFGGYTQQKIEAQPENISVTEESPISTVPQETEEIQTKIESLPTQTAEPTLQKENTPTPTIDPLISAKTCLAKTWEINGLSDYVIAAVPPEMAQEYSLEYVETTGKAYLTLTPDGKIALYADNLVFEFTARMAIFEVPVTVSIDGTANGIYNLDETTLTVNDMDTSGLTASAKALNEDLMGSDEIIDAIPFVRPPFNKAKYNCQGENLELELSGYPGDLPPLTFKALK